MKTARPVVVLVLVMAVVIGGGYLIDQYIHRGVELGLALERAKVAEAKVVQLDLEILAKNAEISSRDETIAESVRKDAEREAWFRQQLAGVQTATPTQLVDQVSEILGVSDITTDGATVTMSVETYRKIAFRLVEHKEYVEVKEPAWNAREVLYKAQIIDLKSVVASHERKDVLNAGIILDLKDVIKHQKSMTFFEKAAWTAGGFAAGFIAGKI